MTYNELNDLFVVIMSTGYVYKSSDGITWTNTGVTLWTDVDAMGTVGGVWWIHKGTNAYFSTDLINWTTRALGYGVTGIVSDGVSMIGLNGNRLVSTTDGVTLVTSPTVTTEFGGLTYIAVRPQG
jgi:hypothetical protein